MRVAVKPSIFSVALFVCILVAAVGLCVPDTVAAAAAALTSTAFGALDWFFMASVSGLVVVALVLATGPTGRIKLGRPGEEPEFSRASWLAMLFAAGMGVGLVFWGVAEPVTHFGAPPFDPGSRSQAARNAMVLTNFHWGLHAWAIYGVGALVLAYFGFRRGEPYLAGAPIRAMFGGRWVAPVAAGADLLAVLAVAFGVAGSVGMGVLQLQTGLNVVVGLPLESLPVSFVILALLIAAYTASASTSLDRGIKLLSNLNMGLALLVLLFVLLAGPTAFLLRTFVTAAGDYASSLMSLSLRLYPFAEVSAWLQSWTLTYFIWWIAWAPFVSVFIARISRGRTIRELIIGVMLAPTLFSILWFAVFGGTALHMEIFGDGGIVELVRHDVTVALFSVFGRLPGSWLLSVATLVLLFVFLVTSVDSATFVLGMLTSRGSLDPAVSRKLAWGMSIGVLSGGLLLSRDIQVIRAVAISGAIPFCFVLLLQVAALLRALLDETQAARARRPSRRREEEAA